MSSVFFLKWYAQHIISEQFHYSPNKTSIYVLIKHRSLSVVVCMTIRKASSFLLYSLTIFILTCGRSTYQIQLCSFFLAFPSPVPVLYRKTFQTEVLTSLFASSMLTILRINFSLEQSVIYYSVVIFLASEVTL